MADRPWDVVGIGQNSLDHVCTVDGLPPFAGKAEMLGYAQLPGGQVATALAACARLGLRCAYVGRVGDDEAAGAVLAPLRERGVDVAGVRVSAGAATRLAVILVDRASGERTVLWHRDARLRLAPEDVPAGLVEQARLLHVDADDPEVSLHAARRARAAGVPVLLDADAFDPALEKLLAAVDFPIVAARFAETLSGTGSVRDGLARLVALGARLAVATLGEGGALAWDGEREITSPGFRIEPRDTTGAGDVFHAAFAWGLLRGLDVETVLRSANAAAALACLAPGAHGGHPTPEALEAFLREHEPGPGRSS